MLNSKKKRRKLVVVVDHNQSGNLFHGGRGVVPEEKFSSLDRSNDDILSSFISEKAITDLRRKKEQHGDTTDEADHNRDKDDSVKSGLLLGYPLDNTRVARENATKDSVISIEKIGILSCAKLQPPPGTYYDCTTGLSDKLKMGDQIAATRTILGVGYAHIGVVLGFRITSLGRLLILVVHWQRPSSDQSQSCKYDECECGFSGPPKYGGLVLSCLECFGQEGFVFKIQHIGTHLVTPNHSKWNDLKPGKVLYRGFCTSKYYLGYFLGSECKGYMSVKRKHHREKAVVNLVRFVETSKRSLKEVFGEVEAMANKCNDSYNLLKNNCEHVAMLFMTGERRSFQVENFPRRIIWKLICCNFRAEGAFNNADTGLPEPFPDEGNREEEDKDMVGILLGYIKRVVDLLSQKAKDIKP